MHTPLILPTAVATSKIQRDALGHEVNGAGSTIREMSLKGRERAKRKIHAHMLAECMPS